MPTYTFRSPVKANRDAVATKLAAKGAVTAKKQEKRIVKPTVLLREDKDDPEKITGVKEGNPEEIDYFIVESDKKP
jgi:hypothetical protein